MAKRVADEYITKDQVSTSNWADDRETSPVKMATPAQLAARKLKTPKSRLGARGNASSVAGFSSITAPNPFAPAQQQATFPPVGGNGGLSFGQQSQSFPPTSTPQTGFNFALPQASSFTFGQDASQSAASSAPSFGFGSNITTNSAQPAPTTFSFGQPGQTNGQSNTSTNQFTFGQNTPAANPFSFGPTPSQPNGQSAPPAPLFSFEPSTSQSTAVPNPNPPQMTSLFGQNNNNNTTTSTQAAQPAFSFGQNAQPNGQSNTASNLFGFGQQSSQPEAPAVSDTLKSNFSFGSINNSNKQESLQPSFSFGKPAETNGQTTTPETSNKFIFGESTLQPPTSVFAQNASEPASSNLFSGSKPAFSFGPTTAPQEPSMDDTMMVSPPRKAPAPPEPRAPSPVREAAPTSTSATDSAPRTEPASATDTLFGQTQTPKFNFSAPSPSDAPATNQNSLFGRINEPPKFSFGAPTNPSGLKSPINQQPAALEPRAPSPVAEITPAPKSPFQNVTPAPEKPKSLTPAEPTPAPRPLFQAPTSALAPTSKSLFGSQPQANARPEPSASPKPTQESAPVVNKARIEFEKVKLRSNGPSEPLITDDSSKSTEYDKKVRLGCLNKQFVERLSKLDPTGQDYDNVIIHYFRTREKLGLMWPPAAGIAKRKADDEDHLEERSSLAKKTKTTDFVSVSTKRKADNEDRPEERSSPPKKTKTIESSGGSNATSNVFNSTPSSSLATPDRGSGGTSPVPTNSIIGPSSKTSNLFQSMLSSKPAPVQSDKPKSPFAGNFSAPTHSTSTPLSSTPLPAFAKATAPAKPVSLPSDEAEDDENDENDENDEQQSGDQNEDDSADDDEVEDEEEEEGSERQGEDGDNDGSDEDEQDEEAPMAKPENQGKSLFDRIQPPPSTGSEKEFSTPNGAQDKTTLKQPAPNHSFKPFTPFPPGVNKSTPQAPTASPLTPFAGSIKSKAPTIFEFTPKAATITPTPVPGASIFAGGSVMSNGPIPGEGLFGSRPSTPNNGDVAPTSVFAGFTKMPNTTMDPAKNNTWAKGSPLKFDTPQFGSGTTTNFMNSFGKAAESRLEKEKAEQRYEDLGSDADEDEIAVWEKEYEEKKRAKSAKVSNFGQGGFKPSVAPSNEQAKGQTNTAPTFSVTAATPPPKSTANSQQFSNLFGQKSPAASPAPPATSSVGFSFGTAPNIESASALQTAASYLFPSGNTSGLSSRATSPGATDNESVDTNGETDATNDPQISLMSERPGEENEEVLYEVRTKALRFLNKEAAARQKGSTPDAFNSVGLGTLRVLKNAETGKTRIVIRAEPLGNVLLNTHLAAFVSYTSYSNPNKAETSGAVRIGVPTENGKVEQWVLKVKNSQKADKLADILTKNKPSA